MAGQEFEMTEDGVLFTIDVDAATHQCLISREALNKLSQLKNVDASDADALDIFKAFEAYIRPVAHDLFKARRPQKTIRLTSDCITRAYDCTTRH